MVDQGCRQRRLQLERRHEILAGLGRLGQVALVHQNGIAEQVSALAHVYDTVVLLRASGEFRRGRIGGARPVQRVGASIHGLCGHIVQPALRGSREQALRVGNHLRERRARCRARKQVGKVLRVARGALVAVAHGIATMVCPPLVGGVRASRGRAIRLQRRSAVIWRLLAKAHGLAHVATERLLSRAQLAHCCRAGLGDGGIVGRGVAQRLAKLSLHVLDATAAVRVDGARARAAIVLGDIVGWIGRIVHQVQTAVGGMVQWLGRACGSNGGVIQDGVASTGRACQHTHFLVHLLLARAGIEFLDQQVALLVEVDIAVEFGLTALVDNLLQANLLVGALLHAAGLEALVRGAGRVGAVGHGLRLRLQRGRQIGVGHSRKQLAIVRHIPRGRQVAGAHGITLIRRQLAEILQLQLAVVGRCGLEAQALAHGGQESVILAHGVHHGIAGRCHISRAIFRVAQVVANASAQSICAIAAALNELHAQLGVAGTKGLAPWICQVRRETELLHDVLIHGVVGLDPIRVAGHPEVALLHNAIRRGAQHACLPGRQVVLALVAWALPLSAAPQISAITVAAVAPAVADALLFGVGAARQATIAIAFCPVGYELAVLVHVLAIVSICAGLHVDVRAVHLNAIEALGIVPVRIASTPAVKCARHNTSAIPHDVSALCL